MTQLYKYKPLRFYTSGRAYSYWREYFKRFDADPEDTSVNMHVVESVKRLVTKLTPVEVILNEEIQRLNRINIALLDEMDRMKGRNLIKIDIKKPFKFAGQP